MYRSRTLLISAFTSVCLFACNCSGDAKIANTAPESQPVGTNSPGSGATGYFYAFKFKTASVTNDIIGSNIVVSVPAGTDVTNLIAVFDFYGAGVKVGNTPQFSNVTANNFTSPVTYSVIGYSGNVTQYTVTVVSTSTDIFAPMVSAVVLSATTFSTYPANLTADIYVSDYGSGVASMDLIFCSPDYYTNSSGNYLVASATDMGGYYRATITLQNYHQSGVWRICYISARDHAGNNSSYLATGSVPTPDWIYLDTHNNDMYSTGIVVPTFFVTSTVPDVTAPALTSITLTPSSVSSFPATVTVRINYVETQSGISLSQAVICSPGAIAGTGNQKLSPFLTNFGTYLEGTITLQNYNAAGAWRVCGVALWDNANHQSNYVLSPGLSTANFALYAGSTLIDSGVPLTGQVTVLSSAPDLIPPVMTSISATPTNLSTYPSTVTVRINFAESGSGIAYGYAEVCSPSELAGAYGSRLYSGTSTYQAGYMDTTFSFSQFAENGIWKVCAVSLVDKAGNQTDYDFIRGTSATNFSVGSYTIPTTYSDSGIPILAGISKN